MQNYGTENCGDCGTETCDSQICSLFMQDYGTETSGDCGTETCDIHICSCRTMVQIPVATMVQRLIMTKSVHVGLWYMYHSPKCRNCGDCGTETCDSHICSCRTMVQRPVATVVQRLVIAIYVHAGLWYRDQWRLWYREL
jgi:hypothetical protein